MALRLTLSACIEDSCGKLIVTDTTGVYHVTNNPYGWGTPNMQGNGVTSATLTITFPDGAEEEYDVLSQIPATVTGDIEFNELEDDYPDGIYEITLTLNGTTSATKTLKKLFVCHACCCVSKMWAKIPDKFYDLSDIEYLKYLDQCFLAQGLLNGITSAGGCLKTDIVDNILEKITRLCEFESCDC